MMMWTLIEPGKLLEIIISAKEHLGYYKFKHRPRLDEGCSKLSGQRKQAKLLWLQDQNQKMGII
jgi:hypothetical protein